MTSLHSPVANSTAGSARFASAGEVLAQWGETTFRNLETQVLREVLGYDEDKIAALRAAGTLG